MNCPICDSSDLLTFEYSFNLTRYRCKSEACRLIFYVKDLDKEVRNKLKETIELINLTLNEK